MCIQRSKVHEFAVAVNIAFFFMYIPLLFVVSVYCIDLRLYAYQSSMGMTGGKRILHLLLLLLFLVRRQRSRDGYVD